MLFCLRWFFVQDWNNVYMFKVEIVDGVFFLYDCTQEWLAIHAQIDGKSGINCVYVGNNALTAEMLTVRCTILY